MISEITHFDRFLNVHPEIVLAVVLIAMFVSVLSRKEFNGKLLVVYVGTIIYLTLLNRSEGGHGINLHLFWTYRYAKGNDYLKRQIIFNIGLFVPLGTIISQLAPQWKNMRILLLSSVAIELMQLISGRGLFELDDVFNNTIGGLIGFAIGMFFVKLKEHFGGNNKRKQI